MANNNPINPPIERQVAPRNIHTLPLEELTEAELTLRLKVIELKQREKAQAAIQLAEDQAAAAQKANSDNMVAVAEDERRKQAACPHIKPRGAGTALAGQKTHRGWFTLVCQYCGKQFSDPPQRPTEQIPPHLMPDMHMVGGPH